MNSVTKIGAMALTKIFVKKPFTSNGKTYISKITFSKEEIDFTLLNQEDDVTSYKIWSIELGIIDIRPRSKQNLYQVIVKTLKKLQKEDVPSHLIIGQTAKKDDEITTTYTIFRLTEEQELTMYYQDLLPSINKRWEKLETLSEKQHEEYLAWYEKKEKEYAHYLATINY